MAWGFKEYAEMHGVKYTPPHEKKKKKEDEEKEVKLPFKNIYETGGVSSLMSSSKAKTSGGGTYGGRATDAPPQPLPESGMIKRSAGSLGIGLLEGGEGLRDKYNITRQIEKRGGMPMPERAYVPLITPEYSERYEEKLGLKGTLGESIWRGIGKETPAIIASYGAVGAATKIPKIGKALTGAGKWTETGRRGVAAGAVYTPIAEEDPTMKDYLENMALFGVGDVAFMGAAHGIGKGISKGKEALKGFKRAPKVEQEPLGEISLDYLLGESPAPIREQLALPAPKEPLALREGVNWEFHPGADFTIDPAGKAMAKGVAYPPARIPGVDYSGDVGLRGKQRAFIDADKPVPRSDIGDPEYLTGLRKRYSDFIDAEVSSMKDEIGGVLRYRPGEDAPLLRASMNPAWYRDFWQKHLRAPREGEWRDLAIRNLIEGNPETGEPANDEFLAILSELSRGQELPEEWHGLQKGIREMDSMQEPELAPLIDDMQAEQAKVEPYGLTRDMGRLNEAENTFRGRMLDQADFGQYEGVRFKAAANSLDNRELAPTFYSQLQRVIEQKMPNRATPEQIRGILGKGAVKEEELKWADLDGFLEGKQKVTKQEVLDYLKQNDVRVEEVEPSSTEYDRYQLPGGENYRELLFTMPGENQYQSGHWEEPNVLAHVRFNDRTGANGEKVLHIEEIQSDWHQEGRKKGYQEKPLGAWEAFNPYDGKAVKGFKTEAEAKIYADEHGLDYALAGEGYTGQVPDAPFKTTWPEFVMKRMIRYAAENGYERVTWPTAELVPQIELWGRTLEEIKSDPAGMRRYGAILERYSNKIPNWLNKYAKKWGAKVEDYTYRVDNVDNDANVDNLYNLYAYRDWEKHLLEDSREYFSDEIEYLRENFVNPDTNALVVKNSEGDWRDELVRDFSSLFDDEFLDSWYDVDAEFVVHSIPITDAMRNSVLYEGQPKFKRTLTPEQKQDLKVLKEVAEERKIGPFRIGKVELAPEAMERPEFKAAGEIAEKLGLRLVTYRGKGAARGAQYGRTIYLSESVTDPLDYVFWHETAHSMATTHRKYYERLLDLCFDHLADAEGVNKHYWQQGYAREERPHEFIADVFAEAVARPGFFARMAEQAPELIKPLLEAIDRLIANVKGKISEDDTIVPFLRDWEALREKIREEVATPYFRDAMGEKQFVETFGKQWQEPAAKAKVETAKADPTNTPEFRKWFGDSKVVDESGKPLVVYHGTPTGGFNVFNPELKGTRTRHDLDAVGFHFTDNPDYAQTYSKEYLKKYYPQLKEIYGYVPEGSKAPEKAMTYQVFLSIENPIRVEKSKDITAKLIKYAQQKGYDGIITSHGGGTEYVVFSPTQIKSVYNRGTFDPTNPDIRFKLGEAGKSPVDDFKAMVQYGVKQIPKGNFAHFSKLIQQQFPDELAGYGPEITERLMKDVWEHSRRLRDTGETVVTMQGQQYPIKRADVASKGRAANGGRLLGDMGEVDTSSHIVSKTQRDPIIAKESAKMVYTKAVDDLYRLDELDRFVAKTSGKHLPAEDKAYLLAINSREATGTARAILEENLVDAQGNIIGKSFKDVLSNIPRGKEQAFRDYLVLRNSVSWMEQGKGVYPEKWGMTPEKALQRLAAYDQQVPELKRAADEYVNWHRQMAKSWLVDTGIITPEAWGAFLEAHPHYTPFQRQMKPIETTPGQSKARRGFANQTNPTKKAEGSERAIIDPIESTIEQVDRYIKTAKRNEVMQAVIRNLEKAPEELEAFAEVIPEKGMDALDNIEAILGKDGIDGVISYLEEPFEQMAARKGKAEQALDKPNVVKALVNGKRVHVKVNDPVLLDALTALSDTGRNAIVESFRTATRLMKILTTGGNPIFAARNISRDVPMAYVASETLSKTPIVREAQFAWGIVDALARIVTKEKWHPDKYYREYKAMGGGSHTASVAADRNLLAESRERVMPGYWRPESNNPLTYIGKGAKAGFQGIERFTSTVEALPRLPEYIRTVKKGGNDYASRLEGLHASQDVTVNFSRHGATSKDADAFIPYFNAAVQGIDKIGRLFGSDPLSATYRSLVAVTIPTVGLYLLNKDNPNYHKLSYFIRDNYYCLPVQGGKKFIKVAKPREIGVVFSDLPERALRQWEADDPEGFYQFSEAWINNFVPPIRPIFMPAADVLANKDFAGRPIVPGYMERLSPELQYDEKTSAAAKAIGNTLKLSPKQIDYLFRSFTGVVGELGIPAMAEGRGQNAGQRVGEVLKRTFTADPLYSNDVMNKFYEQKERLDTAVADYSATGSKGEYYDPRRQREFSGRADRISNIRKEIRRVNADPSLSYEEKEKRTRRMQANMLEIAQGAVEDRFSQRIAR